ncbi:MAG: hypothetical protein WCY78_07250 [Sphaerochaetaceae bacterium]
MIAMMMLLVAIGTTLLYFLAAIYAVRSIFSRQGWFWVIPFLLSLIFLYMSLTPLYQVAIGIKALGTYRSIDEIFPLIIAFLWFLLVVTMRAALRIAVPANKHLIDTKKSLEEARYINEIELRKYRQEVRRLRRQATRVRREQMGTIYPLEWVALYDEYGETS